MKCNSNERIKSTWLLDQLLEWSYENQQWNAAPVGLRSHGRLNLSPRYPQPRILILEQNNFNSKPPLICRESKE